MGLIKTKGIVLRKYDIGEYDRLIDIFTSDYGRISAIIKGIRKSKKRSMYGVDLLVESDFILYERNTKYTISSIDLIEPFLGLKKGLDKINISMYLLHILKEILVENEIRKELYYRTKKGFKFIEKNSIADSLVMIIFYLYNLINDEGIGFYGEINYLLKNDINLTEIQKKTLKMLNKFDIEGINRLKLRNVDLIEFIKNLEKIIYINLDCELNIKNYLNI